MSWHVVADGCLRIQFSRSALDDAGRPRDPTIAALLRKSVDALVAAAKGAR
jgi:hypothetical protein